MLSNRLAVSVRAGLLVLGLIALLPCLAAGDEVPLAAWAAPPYWLPAGPESTPDPAPVPAAREGEALAALPSGALPFFAITPCRLVDTRGVGTPWVGDWGPPALLANTPRSFAIPAGPCPGIPASAAAYSLNFTVLGEPGVYQNAFLSAWPTGSLQPTVSTLNFSGGQLFINAAVVPAGTAGAIDVLAAAGAHLVLDVNGYYAPLSAVTSLNTLTGAVTLAQGSNVTLTPSGQTLTIAAGPLVTSVEGLTGAVDVAATHGATVSASGSTLTVGTNATPNNTAGAIVARDPAGGFSAGTVELAGSPFLLTTGGDPLLHRSGGNEASLYLGVGAGAAAPSSSGINNTGVGADALAAITAGTGNVAVGLQALRDNVAGSGNVAVGSSALAWQSYDPGGGSTHASENTAVGSLALMKNQPTTAIQGRYNVAVGARALKENTTGSDSTAVGTDALASATTNGGNTAVGSGALRANTLGYGNVAVGRSALGSSTTALRNTALGYEALFSLAFDNSAAAWLSRNTAVGWHALYATAPASSTTGIDNTAVGASALEANVSGAGNTAVGSSALAGGTTGGGNTAVGASALAASAGGAGNTAVGSGSLGNASASYNTAVGFESLNQNRSGTTNVALGYRAGYNETGSHKLHIANSDSKTLIWGDFVANRVAINNTAATDTLDVNGTLRVRTYGSGSTSVCRDANGVLGTCTSDARLKTNVVPLADEVDVVAALARLRGVAFDWDTAHERARDLGDRREIGLLAQDVEAVLPQVVATDPDGYKSLDYAKLTAYLVEVAKVQQGCLERQQAEIEELRRLVREMVEERRERR